MDKLGNPETKEYIKNEIDMLPNYVKCEISASNRISIPLYNYEDAQTEFIKSEYSVKASCDIDHVNCDSSILNESIVIKNEDMKIEAEFNSYSDDQNSTVEHSPYQNMEFVEILDIKIEEADDCDKNEDICDPIYINEGTLHNYSAEPFATDETRSNIHEQQSTSTSKKTSLADINKELSYTNKEEINKISPDDETTHMLTHTANKPHKCTYCPKTYSKSSQLIEHIRSHTGVRPFKCSLCNKACSRAGDLEKHMRIHTGDKPHKCVQCNKSFSQSGALTQHIRSHTGERPHRCVQCDRGFVTSSHLKEHMRTHTGERPYECTYCDKAFFRSGDLRKHTKIHLRTIDPN